MFAFGTVLPYSLLAGVLAGLVIFALPWGRRRGRALIAGAATIVGFSAWYVTLDATHAAAFNTDAPVVGLSWADAGSGVVAFVVCALILGLVAERDEPARSVVGAAALAGLVAMVLDLFVL